LNSKATRQFWRQFEGLPPEAQRVARKNYRLWLEDQRHPSLHFKPFKRDLWSVRVGIGHRALGVFLSPDRFRWPWIGSHEEYNKL